MIFCPGGYRIHTLVCVCDGLLLIAGMCRDSRRELLGSCCVSWRGSGALTQTVQYKQARASTHHVRLRQCITGPPHARLGMERRLTGLK